MIYPDIDYNRRDLNYAASVVKEALPEFFVEEYPKLVTFLEAYFEYLENTSVDSFKREINNLINIRDIGETDEKYLDLLITEIGSGLKSSTFFQSPRLIARLLADFYRAKGTVLSAEGFFRAFFNERVSIEYPKRQMFIVGESEIGYESLRYIQDNRLYQVFSILVKSGLSVNDYENLYKKLVHPAGWYFGAEVVIETEVNLNIIATSEEDLFYVEPTPLQIVGQTTVIPTPQFTKLTAIVDSDATGFRVDVDDIISTYGSVTIAQADDLFENIAEIFNPNSPTFDNDDATNNVDMSSTFHTFDEAIFTRYLSDSSY